MLICRMPFMALQVTVPMALIRCGVIYGRQEDGGDMREASGERPRLIGEDRGLRVRVGVRLRGEE